jgi:uncharacterized repeat protein (TIGR03803 family)
VNSQSQMKMLMKTTKAIFGVLKVTLGLRGRIRSSSLVPLLSLLFILPVSGAQAAVVFTNLYSFTGANDGAYPCAGLVQGNDGYFYGTTTTGGTNGFVDWQGNFYGYGTVFRINTNGALTTLYSFGGNDGDEPFAGLVQGSDGYFYGTTWCGGNTNLNYPRGYGTVFKISTNGALTTLYSFGSVLDTDGSPLDNSGPLGLVQGSNGSLYGTTGSYGRSTVFTLSASGALTTLYSEEYLNPGLLVGWFNDELVQGSDGSLYGTTLFGGGCTNLEPYGCGTVFQISTHGAFASLYSFTGGSDGAHPEAGLVQGNDGYFYGTTSGGGNTNLNYPRGYGTVFRISANGALTSLYSFTGGNDGGYPGAVLVRGSDGSFYGTTTEGGTYSNGTMYRISTNGALTTLYSFGGNDGSVAPRGLVQGSDGNFYGTTSGGGTHNNGIVFRLTIVPQPQLSIIPSEPFVIVTWPTNYVGFTLQSTTNLGSSAVWNTYSSPPVVICGQNVVINAISGRQQYFRLSH